MSIEYKDIKTKITAINGEDVFYAKFANGGSEDLAVNGGTTPVEFTLENLPDENFLLKRITFLLAADEIIDVEKFGSISALANGVSFKINEGTTQQKEIVNKTNADIMLSASEVEMEVTNFAAVQASILYGIRDFRDIFENAPIVLDKKIKITVNDDLSALKFLRVSCHGIILNKS